MNGEAKHTPGPWMIRFGGLTDADEGFTVASASAENQSVVAEYWPCMTDVGGRRMMLADAHLIKSAPDLLQALTELTQSASEYLSQVPPEVAPKNAEILRADVDKAREAIARAKGE